MASMTATDARKQLYALLDEVAASHEPVQIAGKRNSAVLIAEEDWRAIQETLYLVSIPGCAIRSARGSRRRSNGAKRISTGELDAGLHRPGPARCQKLARSGLKPTRAALLALLAEDPWQNPPPFERLVGDLTGACSRRINIQHRLVYQVLEAIKTVKVIRMWTQYG
jgi:Txe/YoeB family toxin of toxin-antitoxin system